MVQFMDNLLEDRLLEDIFTQGMVSTAQRNTTPTMLDRERNPTVVDAGAGMPSLEKLIEANIANMGKKQRLDYNASRQGQPAPVAVPAPQEIADAQSVRAGWTPVKGMESFMRPGASGRYRVEDGITPEGQRATAAANSLRAYNKDKYGGSGQYGGAGAEVLNSADVIAELGRTAFAAGSEKRSQNALALQGLEEQFRDLTTRGGQPPGSLDELAKRISTLRGMNQAEQQFAEKGLDESVGIAPELLAPLEAMAKEQRQRDEYGQLASMLSGEGQGFPGGMSKETYGQLGAVRKAQNEERRLDNQDRTFSLAANRDARAAAAAEVPKQPSAAMVKLHAQSLLPPGTTVARLNGADVLVKVGTQEVVPDGDRIIKQATQQAYQKLLGGGKANPAITQNPAVQAIKELEQVRQSGGQLRPDQQVLYDRFQQNRVEIKKYLIERGMAERDAAAQAIILSAGSTMRLR